MSFSLTNNFFKNARALTFTDGGGVTWSFNKSTNSITATASGGGGTVTSVGLADTSTSAIYTITNSPVTTSGTIDMTLATQSANLVFAGPTTGAAAQPTFRSLVAADVPALGANPAHNVELTATNGTATTYLRSDCTLALDQSISPTWTGNHTFSASSGIPAAFNAASTDAAAAGAGRAWTARGSPNHFTTEVQGSATSGQSYGQLIQAGTTSADRALDVINQANTAVLFRVFGDGGAVMGAATGGDEGAGTINVSGGYYVNGVRIGSGSGTGANVQTLTQAGGTSQSYTPPAGAKFGRMILIGGGGGGGAGAANSNGGSASGGGAGQGGGVSISDFDPTAIGGSLTVLFTSTTGGAGASAVTAASGATTSGGNGTAGSNVTVKNASGVQILIANGGAFGGGGGIGVAGAAGSGAGTGKDQTGTAGGAGGATGAGGVGTGNQNSTLTASNYAPVGGGGGAGSATAASAQNGGAGGAQTGWAVITGGASGVGVAGSTTGGNGGNGGASPAGALTPGSGGGGGGNASNPTAAVASVGGTGGSGIAPGCGGGGGGGANRSATGSCTSGAGGSGGPAQAIFITW